MMRPSVARLDLCRRLFELSGWNTTIWSWYCDEAHDDDPALNLSEPLNAIGGVGHFDHQYPAYDLGYLLRALPAKYQVGDYLVELTIRKEDNIAPKGIRYLAYYSTDGQGDLWCQIASTPEDAAAELAIHLFEIRHLTPEND